MNDFLLKSVYSGYHVETLGLTESLVLAGFFWYHSGRRRERCHFITVKWKQKSRFPTLLILEKGERLSSLLLSRVGSLGSPLGFHWYYPLSWVQQKCFLTIPHMASRHHNGGGVDFHILHGSEKFWLSTRLPLILPKWGREVFLTVDWTKVLALPYGQHWYCLLEWNSWRPT